MGSEGNACVYVLGQRIRRLQPTGMAVQPDGLLLGSYWTWLHNNLKKSGDAFWAIVLLVCWSWSTGLRDL
jgi:hypothetical protein